MPAPSLQLTTTRADLLEAFQEFSLEADEAGYIWHRACPIIEVALQAGVYGKIPIEELLKNPETRRNPRSGYARGNWRFTTAGWATEERGFEEPIDEREATMYADFVDADMVSYEIARGMVMMGAEKAVADLLFNATTFSSQKTTLTNEWDDADNATPIDDIEVGVNAIYDRTGLWADTLIVNRKVFRNLRKCTQILERIQSSGAGDRTIAGDVTAEKLAEVFDLRQVLVAGGSKNTAAEGQTAVISQIWSNEYAMLCRLAPENSTVRVPSLSRTFHWGEDGSTVLGLVEEYEEPQTRARILRARHDVDYQLQYPELGQLFDNVTT